MPNKGDVMFPLIGPGFVWLSKFRIDIEMMRVKRRSLVGDPITLRMPPPVAACAFAMPPVDDAAPCDFDDPSLSGPNPMVFATRRFIAIWPGPRPKFLPTIVSPAVGLGSSRP